MKKPFKAAIFDIDGVLIPTEGLQFQAWVEALRGLYGISDFSVDIYKKGFVGNTHEYIAHKIAETFTQVKPDELLPVRKQIIDRLVQNSDYKTMPLAKQAIQYFTLKNVPIAFATGAVTNESIVKLRKSGLDKLVEEYNIPVIGKDMLPKGRGKPAPDSYLVAADALGLKADKLILTFEDTPAGAHSAVAAGTTCFAVMNEWTRNSKLFPEEVIKCNRFLEVIDHVHRNYVFKPSRE